MNHSTEKQKVTGKRNQRTLIAASQFLCTHVYLGISVFVKFGENANFVQIVLSLLWLRHSIVFFRTFFRKINFLSYQILKPTENRLSCLTFIQKYWILMEFFIFTLKFSLESGLDSFLRIFCDFFCETLGCPRFRALQTTITYRFHLTSSSTYSHMHIDLRQRHHFWFNKFHSAHARLILYDQIQNCYVMQRQPS